MDFGDAFIYLSFGKKVRIKGKKWYLHKSVDGKIKRRSDSLSLNILYKILDYDVFLQMNLLSREDWEVVE